MRICIVGESPTSPTGFGYQTKILGEAFEEYGHNVYYLCGTASTLQESSQKSCMNEWQVDNIYNPGIVEHNLARIAPDVVLVFRDIPLLLKSREWHNVYQNAPVFYWVAEEGVNNSRAFKNNFKVFPKNRLIPLTKYTADTLPNCGRVIPHGIVPSEFKERGTEDKEDIIERWNKKMGWGLPTNKTILLTVDRNAFWKCWDSVFDVLSKTQDTVLIAHTKTKTSKFAPWNFKELEELYDVKGRVFYTDTNWSKGLSREEVLDLYQLADISLSCSSGEGFGMGYIEAAASGTPQIVNGCPAAKELLDPRHCIEPAGNVFFGGKVWARPNSAFIAEEINTYFWIFPEGMPNLDLEFAEQVKKKYDIMEIAADFLDEFEEAVKDKDLRRKYRWGLDFGNKDTLNILKILAGKKFGRSFFHLKCWEGDFVERCLATGMPASGIEDEIGFFNERVGPYCRQTDLRDKWGRADILVATDVFDHLQRYYAKDIWTLLDRFKSYKLCFLRFNPDMRWGMPMADREAIKTYLNSIGLVRRNDAEDIVKHDETITHFDHEIWAMPDKS